MIFDLKGKKALVTGGSRGIGGAIARSLAQAGADVAILGRNKKSLEEQAKRLVASGINVLSYECDVLMSSSLKEVWTDLESRWGGVDILINNVGGGGRWGSENLLETSLTTWEEVMRKNLGAAIQLTTSCLPYMLKKKWGRIISITSIYGVYIGGRPWFNVAKVAQTTFTRNLARNPEFVRSGITFNAIAPGAIYIEDTGWSDMERDRPIEFNRFLDSLPLGRMGTPEEVASLALFICSDSSTFLNGASITLDGGESCLIV